MCWRWAHEGMKVETCLLVYTPLSGEGKSSAARITGSQAEFPAVLDLGPGGGKRLPRVSPNCTHPLELEGLQTQRGLGEHRAK